CRRPGNRSPLSSYAEERAWHLGGQEREGILRPQHVFRPCISQRLGCPLRSLIAVTVREAGGRDLKKSLHYLDYSIRTQDRRECYEEGAEEIIKANMHTVFVNA